MGNSQVEDIGILWALLKEKRKEPEQSGPFSQQTIRNG
jgi:hypothetical protein